ncbi:MAG: low molecular weight protein-tyrosine-phosphatase [Luteimonas sp.]
MRLLVVCLGNICRSPMAEGALRNRLSQAGLDDSVIVDSAGTGSWHVGDPPDPRAIATAARHGVDISGLRARRLATVDYDRFDWMLCADPDNLRQVRASAPPGARASTSLLLDWAGHGDKAVPDPYTGGEAEFERVWSLVDDAAVAIVARLRTRDAGLQAD